MTETGKPMTFQDFEVGGYFWTRNESEKARRWKVLGLFMGNRVEAESDDSVTGTFKVSDFIYCYAKESEC